MNSWDDQNVRDALAANGRKKIVVAGLWTEVCNTTFALCAMLEGDYEIYMVADASGGTSADAHKYAMEDVYKRQVPVRRRGPGQDPPDPRHRQRHGGGGHRGARALRACRDVYKRQPPISAWAPKLSLVPAVVESEAANSDGARLRTRPVSYTHLLRYGW